MAVIKGRDGRVLLFAGRKALLTTGQTGGVATTSPTPVVTAITLSPATGTASSASGTVIGTLSATVTGGVLMSPAWTLTNTAGGDFQIVGGNQVAFLPSNVPAGSYTITPQVSAENLATPFSQAVTVTIGAAQSSGSTTTPSAMSQAFTVTNWGSAASPGIYKRGVWFKRGDVPAGTGPALSSGTAQFYGLSFWKDGSLKRARMLTRDTTLAAGASRSYALTNSTGSMPTGAVKAIGNAGLVAALSGHDFKVTFTNVKDSTSATYGGGTLVASMTTHAAVGTRWELLTTGAVADVWQGWGMAGNDAHLKVNWYVTRWKNADGSTLAWQIGAELALDWWNVAGKSDLTYDAVLSDGAIPILSFAGVQHYYHSRWLMCINDGGLNAGAAPIVGVAQPTLHCAYDREYAVSTGLFPPLDTAKRPALVIQCAYVPCNIVADPSPNGENSHRNVIDAQGGYQGRGVITRFDADAFMNQTPQAAAIARLNALTGLGVPYHYRSSRQRTRLGEAADVANTNIPLTMLPKPASASDFTSQGLPIAVDAYISGSQTDGFVTATLLPNNPWRPAIDPSHAVSYCYYTGITGGEEWFVEAGIDLAMNLAHQGIYGYHNFVQPFARTYNQTCPSDYWTGLLGQFHTDNIRYVGWSQLVQGHGVGGLPDDHQFRSYAKANQAHQGDYIGTNLDYLPADFAASGTYYPESSLPLLYSPWMGAFGVIGSYANYLANEDARWQRLGDHMANWPLAQAEAGRWYCFDIYRTANRRMSAPWNAATNPQIAPAQQGFLQIKPSVKASTGIFTNDGVAQWAAVGFNAPSPRNGDRVTFTTGTDGGNGGTLPAGVADGTVGYVINCSAGDGFTCRSVAQHPATFQVSAIAGGAPMSFSQDQSNMNVAFLPQAAGDYAVITSDPNNFLAFPYVPTWDNYVPAHVSAIMMARQAGNPRATKALRDGAVAFTAPMDANSSYYSAFDMATTG